MAHVTDGGGSGGRLERFARACAGPARLAGKIGGVAFWFLLAPILLLFIVAGVLAASMTSDR